MQGHFNKLPYLSSIISLYMLVERTWRIISAGQFQPIEVLSALCSCNICIKY